jgi:hypothetical protein
MTISMSMAAWTLVLMLGVTLIWIGLLSSVAYLATQGSRRR